MFKKHLRFKKVMAAILSAAVIITNCTGALPVMAVSSSQAEAITAGGDMSDENLAGEIESIQTEVTESLPLSDSSTISWDEDKEEVDLPKRYSAKDQGFTPAVRDQRPYGNCWSHAGIACLEIGMLRNNLNMGIPAEQFELSIPHAIYYGHRPVTDPLGLNADDVLHRQLKNMKKTLLLFMVTDMKSDSK